MVVLPVNMFDMSKTFIRFRKIVYWVRGMCLSALLRLCGCKVGSGLKCRKWPDFRQPPRKNIIIGNDVTIGKRITFDIASNGALVLGNNVNLTQDIVISSAKKVTIGRYTIIAEHVSIRDADHGFEPDECIANQAMVSEEVIIGDDVWIGAGVRVLRGVIIPSGSVIAANGVVTKKTNFANGKGVYAGMPAQYKKAR